VSLRVVGIDPGITGAIALIEHGTLSWVYDMDVSAGEIDAFGLFDLIDGVKPLDMIFLEETHAMPKTGSQGNFSQGFSKGTIISAMAIAGQPLTRVAPSTWKTKMGLRGKPKDFSLRLARELWPDHANDFRLVKHHNRAEAALIARYGLLHLIHQENAS